MNSNQELRSIDLHTGEYHPYYGRYIDILNGLELFGALESGMSLMSSLIDEIPKQKLYYAYAEGKWTVAEVLVHLMDTERIFQYRALRFARNDMSELVGFEQDDYVPHSRANQRTKNSILEEFMAIRTSSLTFFKSLDELSLLRVGKANGAKMSVRALAFVICGHQAHHFKILRERYW